MAAMRPRADIAIIAIFFTELTPPIAPARRPSTWDHGPELVPDWDILRQPEPDFEFDQRVSW